MSRSHTEDELRKAAAKKLRISSEAISAITIRRMSIDARDMGNIRKIYTLDIKAPKEERILKRVNNPNITRAEDIHYVFPASGNEPLKERPIIAGAGPAGLFCAYMLASRGYRPILIERGKSVEERTRDVSLFWQDGILKPESNAQFGEGGAGTFSDGKLNSGVHDKYGRNRKVLEIFAEAGAPADILYKSHPHIGTDYLKDVVKNLREKIREMGGDVLFETKLTDLKLNNGCLEAVCLNDKEWIAADILVLAIGHSARDTFEILARAEIPMSAKAFAVGYRVQHAQSFINLRQYGEESPSDLPAADYKLTARTADGRSAYSFCMCPGGYVVNASSEPGRLVVNGMSEYARAGRNANSAIVLSVTPEDFRNYGDIKTPEALRGVAFQRQLEKKAWEAADGRIPTQLLGDFRTNQISGAYGSITPDYRGVGGFGDVRGILPEALSLDFLEAMEMFERKMPGFADDSVIVTGIESRTSSPVQIHRGEDSQIGNTGIYPCGEGAGYAGGIMSAAIDGIKTAEMIASQYFFRKN